MQPTLFNISLSLFVKLVYQHNRGKNLKFGLRDSFMRIWKPIKNSKILMTN